MDSWKDRRADGRADGPYFRGPFWPRPGVQYNTLCNDFENGGLKIVDVFSKIASLQCF